MSDEEPEYLKKHVRMVAEEVAMLYPEKDRAAIADHLEATMLMELQFARIVQAYDSE